MVRYTITPWRHPNDLLTVRSQLYQLDKNGPDQRHQAVTRILAWKLRSSNLPHAVESTALLIDSILHATIDPRNSAYSIRAVYAAAFTRFVTGFADIGRARSGKLAGPENQSSMLEIARQIGMPSQFVALRHEATHEELPSVGRLRKAVQQGLEWLWEVYWSRLPEVRGMAEVVVEVEQSLEDEMRIALKCYRSLKVQAFKGKKQGTRQDRDVLGAGIEQIGALLTSSMTRLELLAALLVDEKLLFPANRALGASMEGAFRIWDDLLAHIDQMFFQVNLRPLTLTLTNKLLQSLQSQATEHDVDAEDIYLWLIHLTDATALPELKAEVMKYCCLHGGYWTQKLGARVLSDADETFEDDWAELFKASEVLDSESEQATVEAAAEEDEKISGVDVDATADASSISPNTANACMIGGWRLAATKPGVPIGIVL